MEHPPRILMRKHLNSIDLPRFHFFAFLSCISLYTYTPPPLHTHIYTMVSDKFDAIKVGTGEDLVTLTRWVIAQQQVSYLPPPLPPLFFFFSYLDRQLISFNRKHLRRLVISLYS